MIAGTARLRRVRCARRSRPQKWMTSRGRNRTSISKCSRLSRKRRYRCCSGHMMTSAKRILDTTTNRAAMNIHKRQAKAKAEARTIDRAIAVHEAGTRRLDF
jgi:hypothetical protein